MKYYDLSNPLHRKQFVARANKMLEKCCGRVRLSDESNRTLNQNRYLHVLIRIMAMETGVKEHYAKQVYFKTFANPQWFLIEQVDPVTGEIIQTIRSSSELTVGEMSNAIDNFRHWAEDNGYYLPEANEDSDGNLTFSTPQDKKAFEQAEIETDRISKYID